MKVGTQRDGAFLVGGVDDAVERFSGLGRDREEADVVDLCRRRHRSTYAEVGTMPTRWSCLAGELAVRGLHLVTCSA